MDKQKLNILIGSNLKTIREQKGLSLEKMAKKTGVSKPMLGQIERGASNPTVSTLWKIATGLGVSFTSFLQTNRGNVELVKKGDLEPIAEDDGRYLVFPVFPMSEGKPYELYSIEMLPGCNYHSEPHSRGVEEQLWVEKGELSIEIGGNSYTIHEQEGIRFNADHSHVYYNLGDGICTATLAIYYPTP